MQKPGAWGGMNQPSKGASETRFHESLMLLGSYSKIFYVKFWPYFWKRKESLLGVPLETFVSRTEPQNAAVLGDLCKHQLMCLPVLSEWQEHIYHVSAYEVVNNLTYAIYHPRLPVKLDFINLT